MDQEIQPRNDSESEDEQNVDIEVLSVEEYGAEENFDVQNVMEIPVEEQALPGLLNGNDPINEENQNNYQQERNEEFYDAENGPPIPRFIRDFQFGAVRNWILRRRTRMNQNEDSDDSSNEEETEENEQKNFREFLNNITFDKNLPTAHSYLGELEECSGVAYQDQDSYQTISLLYVQDFVLVPGQILPLMFTRPNEASMIRQIVGQPNKTLGILIQKYLPWMENEEVEQSSDLFDYGCTAEIRSFMDRESEISSISVVVVGRQKFKLISKRRQVDGNFLAKVQILEDVRLPDMCSSVGLKRCINTPRSYPPSLQDNYKKKLNAIRRSALATSWGGWIYKMYDVNFLQMQIFKELREWNKSLEERNCPREASDFSFWVITNLPITDKKRLQLLRMGSAEQRMRYELHLLQKCTLLACAECGQKIANRNDVFSMSTSGPMAAYVNPGGVVHETLTLYKVSGIFLRGRKCAEHSWFPGYAWTICECRSCGRHMGWKFTAIKSTTNPQKFWGLTRSALRPRVSTYQENESDSSSDDISLWDG